ncbi:Helicase associated domain protein [Streptomyces sp. NPDC049577]|uniref:DEAD/DEAH box helicase n=1 Tax=Streptomyces sp. NPDC049577 TaxID=3155153 RepID=UPI00344516C3
MELRPYQRQITASVVEALREGGAGQVRMACGSGKTLIAVASAERLLGQDGTVAVLVPSLALVAQTLETWRRHYGPRLEALAVCSDETVADAPVHAQDLGVPVTTRPEEITAWLHERTAGLRLVLSTYRSALRLDEALRSTGPLDLLVFDEAHHLSGRLDAPTRQLLGRGRLPSRRRLFMTATPREEMRTEVTDDSVPMIGMEDTSVFGPVLGQYTFAQGISEGYLADYRIVVMGLRDSEARKLLLDEDVEYVDELGAPSLQTVAAQVALGRARETFGIRRVLTFHPRIAAAAEFARSLRRTLARCAPAELDGLYAAHVHGQMDQATRKQVLSHLGIGDEGWCVISNARCLGEGVDLPRVDAVLFAHPKRSAVDITQAVGRALRTDPSLSGPSVILVPIVVPDDDGEIGDLEPGDFETLWQVVRALRAFDEDLSDALNRFRMNNGISSPSLPDKITFMLPPGISDAVVQHLKVLMVRQTTSVWWEGYGEAVRYHQEHGHLLVPADHVTEGGLRLGPWIAQLRYRRRRGRLSPQQIELLDELGMVWDPYAAAFAAVLQEAARFRAEHGHLRIPATYQTPSGYTLGRWLEKRRRLYADGTIRPEEQAALEALGVHWPKIDIAAEAWQTGIRNARAFRDQYGHTDIPKSYTAPDGHRTGAWINTQRLKYRNGELTDQQLREWDEIGLFWEPREARWQRMYAAAVAFHAEHHHLKVPHAHVTADGLRLGSWILHQRQLRSGIKPGGITQQRIALLDAIGMRW